MQKKYLHIEYGRVRLGHSIALPISLSDFTRVPKPLVLKMCSLKDSQTLIFGVPLDSKRIEMFSSSLLDRARQNWQKQFTISKANKKNPQFQNSSTLPLVLKMCSLKDSPIWFQTLILWFVKSAVSGIKLGYVLSNTFSRLMVEFSYPNKNKKVPTYMFIQNFTSIWNSRVCNEAHM